MRPRLARIVVAAVAIAALVCAGKSTAHKLPSEKKRWFEARTEHFTMTSSLGERKTRDIALELETFRATLGKVLRQLRHDSIRPVHVYVFGKEEQFERHAFGRYLAAGVFMASPTRNYLLIDGSEPRPLETAYHEYVHHLVNQNFIALPLWLSEGIALYYETFAVFGENVELGRNPLRFTRWLKARSWAPLRPILLATHESDAYANPHKTPYFYTQSWLTVNYLLTRQGKEWKKTKRFLSLVSERVPSDEALETAFETTLQEFERKLQIYAQGPIYQYHALSIEQLDAAGSPATRQLEYEKVLIRLGRLLAESPYVEDLAIAANYFEKAATSVSDDVELTMGQGLVELSGRRFEQAATLFRRAIEIDPDNEEPHFHLGIALTEWYIHDGGRVVSTGEPTPDRIREARVAFERAVDLDGTFVQAQNGLCRTYLFGGDPPQRGIEAAKAVLRRGPNLELAVTLMELYARTGNRQASSDVYDTRLAPLRTTLAGHDDKDATGRWKWIESAALRSELIVAGAWAEQGRPEEARALLAELRGGASEESLKAIDDAIADLESRIAEAAKPEATEADDEQQ